MLLQWRNAKSGFQFLERQCPQLRENTQDLGWRKRSYASWIAVDGTRLKAKFSGAIPDVQPGLVSDGGGSPGLTHGGPLSRRTGGTLPPPLRSLDPGPAISASVREGAPANQVRDGAL